MFQNLEWQVQLNWLGLVGIAGLLGAVIGIEREIAGKPAGLRTHIFICAGSALFMLLGRAIVESFGLPHPAQGASNVSADPVRIMQAIVVGISFMGAGTIIHHGHDRIEGLTTAATIFLVAAIGIAVAIDQLILAVFVTLGAIMVLVLLGLVEKLCGKKD